jgi:hypothetical protein
LYDPENELEYILYLFEGAPYGIQKYEYEKTDTTQLTTQHWIYYPNLTEYPRLDTITQWLGEHYYYETFDQFGRKIALRVEYDNIYEGAHIDYKAEYMYTQQNELLHISYNKWIGDMAAGYWQEATRIDNTYNEEGILELYEKTFYDARTGEWVVENSKTYFYSLVPVSLPEDFAKAVQLSIFPNPARDEIRIMNLFRETPDYTIYNLYGSALESGRLENQAIAITRLKPGIYIIEIDDNLSIYTGKFVKY